MKKLIPTRVRPNERGAVIIWTAFFLVFMLGFVALGIDVAKLMATRTQLQNAADAAALAGASAIDFDSGTIRPDSAQIRAQYTAAQNKAFVTAPQPVLLLAGDISYPTPQQVKVTVRRSPGAGGSMVTHVAQVLGITSLEVSATATAQIEPAGSVCEGLIPMAPIADPAAPFEVSCTKTYDLKVDSDGLAMSGNYQLLQFPDCTEGPCGGVSGGGGAAIRCQTENGYGCCVNLNDQWTVTQPGNKVGPFTKGMEARWDSDTDRRNNICYDQYAGNDKRVVFLPIVETFDVSGKKVVKVVSFAAFFLTTRPVGSSMVGQFIYETVPGEPGGGGGTLFTIRLIK